jgi:hypothetical protein
VIRVCGYDSKKFRKKPEGNNNQALIKVSRFPRNPGSAPARPDPPHAPSADGGTGVIAVQNREIEMKQKRRNDGDVRPGKKWRIAALALTALVLSASALSAEEGLAVTGNLNTGLVIDKPDGKDATAHLEREGMPGRARMNFKLTKGNVIVDWSLQVNRLLDSRIDVLSGPGAPTVSGKLQDIFPEAKGTATFWDGQFVLAIGKLEGQWSSGGVVDVKTGNTTAHFTFKPSVIPGLSVGFALPGVNPATYTVAEYFNELTFGAQYVLENTLDARFGVTLDSENPISREGARFVWGLSPTIVGASIPGLTIWIDGLFTGLGITNGLASKTGFKAAYEQGNLGASLALISENFPKRLRTAAAPKTGFYIKPSLSYKVTPAVKPGIDVEIYFYSFESGSLDTFDNVLIAPYIAFDVGNGLEIRPRFALTLKGENGKTTGAGGAAQTDIKFEVRFDYSF